MFFHMVYKNILYLIVKNQIKIIKIDKLTQKMQNKSFKTF